MGGPSAMMGGGRMTYAFDAQRGQAVGSHIRMGGEAFGLRLFVDEVVTVRDPPRRKVWRTTGEPRLIIIGAYEMGFEIAEEDPRSRAPPRGGRGGGGGGRGGGRGPPPARGDCPPPPGRGGGPAPRRRSPASTRA